MIYLEGMMKVCKHLKGAFRVGNETMCQACQIKDLQEQLEQKDKEVIALVEECDARASQLVFMRELTIRNEKLEQVVEAAKILTDGWSYPLEDDPQCDFAWTELKDAFSQLNEVK